MVKKIHHIAIAVKNLDETLKLYEDLFGLKPGKIAVQQDQKVRAALISLGKMELEIMEPLDGRGPIAKFMEKRGEGLHHIAFEVKNVDKELERISRQGADLIDKKGRKGLAGKIGFLHPKSTKGVLIELVQKGGRKNGS